MADTGARTGGPERRGRYHHGDLPSALLEAGLELIAEVGPGGFSAAAVARRVGVSTAAPYRHFADRDRFLAGIAALAADRLAAAVDRAVEGAGPDPADRLAAAAGAYVEVVATQRVGVDLIFSPDLRAARDEELARAGRSVVGPLMTQALAVTGDAQDALLLVERVVVLAHGYATLDTGGFLSGDRVTDASTPDRARSAAAAVIAGSRPPGREPDREPDR